VATHVDFVGVLFIVWGVLTMLVGVSMLALGVAAAALIASATRSGQMAAGLTAAAFLSLGGIALVWGCAHVIAGVPLRRRRHWSRVVALALGAVDLLLLPYGTALGCYALWVLLSEEAKAMFAAV